MHVYFGGGSVGVTHEHPWYVKDKGWIASKKLAPGDMLMTNTGVWAPVERTEDIGEVAPVYNLHVADCHTYFVASSNGGPAVLVHNQSGGVEAAPAPIQWPWLADDLSKLNDSIVAAAAKSEVAGIGNKRNGDFWEESGSNGNEKFKVKDGVDPISAIEDIWNNAEKYEIYCRKLADLIIVKGFIDLFNATGNTAGLQWIRDLVKANGGVVGNTYDADGNPLNMNDGKTFMEHFAKSIENDKGIDVTKLQRGDQVWFRGLGNDGTPGSEGTNVIYDGAKFVFVFLGRVVSKSDVIAHVMQFSGDTQIQHVYRPQLPESFIVP